MPSLRIGSLEHVEATMIYSGGHHLRERDAAKADVSTGVKSHSDFKAVLSSSHSRVREVLRVYDVRPVRDQLDIDTHGFIVGHHKTALPQTLENIFDEHEREIRRIYWPEVEALAKRSVRSAGRLPKYAVAIGTQRFVPERGLEAQEKDPFGSLAASYARVAHADFSEVVFDGAYKMLAKRGVPMEEAKALDLMFINVWKPYGQTVKDNPFAILDWTSVNPATDVHVRLRGESAVKGAVYNSMVSFNPNHRWVYLPEQRDDEVWFFKQADSRAVNKEPASLAQYAFHESFKLPDDLGREHQTRRSIAVRLILGFESSASKL